VIGIGASAGGVDAIIRLVRPLRRDFPAAICIVLHVPAAGRSLLAPILNRYTELQVVVAEDGQRMRAGWVYVAPNDRHLVLDGGHVHLDRGPKENGVRPAVDVMLRTLAGAFGPRAIAVILSGALGDGSAGALAVREAGGVVIVQDPRDALVPSMPASTIAADSPERVVRAAELGGVLSRLFGDRLPDPEGGSTMSEPVQPPQHPSRPAGPASAFTCPECSGALWELREGELLRYRCRVGHSYSEDAMVDAQAASVEAALWAALEVLEERGELLQRIADRMHGRTPNTERRFREDARDALGRAALIRRALVQGSGDEGRAREHHVREAAGG
jgi:two-component system chemotaxis response regulator CheB